MSSMVVRAAEETSEAIRAMLTAGDFEKLSNAERANFIVALCNSLGLNPATLPFAFIKLSGKLTLYALKSATDQLRKVHSVSVERVEQSTENDLHSVTVYVRDASGRTDCDIGVVSIKGLGGEALANAKMRCLTKAKRRSTLSICGLGMLDESELSSIADKIEPAQFVEEAPKTVSYKKPAKAAVQVESMLKTGIGTDAYEASLTAIAECKSLDDMTRLGLEISTAGLAGDDLNDVKQAYRDRMAALKAGV